MGSEEENLDLYLGFVLEDRPAADTSDAVVTVLINDEPLPSGQLNRSRLVFQVEDSNPYQYESYGPDIQEPTMRFSRNAGVSEHSIQVYFYLSIPKLQNRSYTLVPKWKSPQLDSSNLKIIGIEKFFNENSMYGLNIPCVTRPVTDGIPGRSVVLGRMVNAGYSAQSSRYNEIYAKVTVSHEMCNLHAEGANAFYLYAHYSPTQFVYVESSVNYVPVETQLTAHHSPPVLVVECSPTNDVLVSTPVDCTVNVTFAESHTSVNIDIQLTSSGDLLVFNFILDAIHVHTVGSRLNLSTDAFSYQLSSSEDAAVDEKLLTNIGSVELIENTCARGWQFNGNKCYTYAGNASSYSNATRMCNDVNGTIISILSEHENTFVRQFVNNSNGSLVIWLGITDLSVEGDWRWADDKDDSVYSNWQTLKACDWTTNCAVIDVNGTWTFKQCEGLDLDIAVVCEQEIVEKAQQTSFCMDFSFIPLSSPQDFINIAVLVNKDGLIENTTTQVSIRRDASSRPVLQLTYEFNSSESYNLG
ncbi:uncharacterized protein LOC117111471 [Anneissia japonica]|uniref:uncharacterized protein LOC117111471 n=1 Tax=Anneissia japonica TaxID=1529436 RepID=UPI0014255365|nr:uncharacterized protein LOC117111471 [Anneissia japonica]